MNTLAAQRARHLRSTLLLATLCLAWSLAPGLASADAIEGPPACPPGARGESSHAGQWCVAAPCASDADCAGDGGSCRPWRVCTRHAAIPPGGLGAFQTPPPPPREIDLVVGSCETARACRGDEEPPPTTAGAFTEPTPTCTEARYCVADALPTLPTLAPAAPAAPPPTTSGPVPAPAATCGCHALRGHAETSSIMTALGLALAISWGRRRS